MMHFSDFFQVEAIGFNIQTIGFNIQTLRSNLKISVTY